MLLTDALSRLPSRANNTEIKHDLPSRRNIFHSIFQ